MHELKEKVSKICGMKEKLVCAMEATLSQGIAEVNTDEAGKVIDMIKDLAEAEKDCMKAAYYETVICSMLGSEDEMRWGDSRMGYDHWRYASGEFAPKGKGHRSGYIPHLPYYLDPTMNEVQEWDPRMGYSRGQSGTQTATRMTDGSRDVARPSRYGYSYDKFEESKRKYHDSKSASDKDEMDTHAKEHLSDTISTMRDIWASADTTLKKKMKADLQSLIGEMTV